MPCSWRSFDERISILSRVCARWWRRLATERGQPTESLEVILGYNMQEACGFYVGESESKLLVHDLAG
jgi:hypothetical protein